MLPIRWDPFRDLTTLHKELDDLFRRTFGAVRATEGETTLMMTPKVNTFVKENVFHIEAELPGIDKDDLDVSIDGHVLTLRGERKTHQEHKDENYLMRESSYGSFLRRLPLPEGADVDQVHASYENGILSVTMPISRELAGSRKVLIEGGTSTTGEKKIH